MRLNFLLVVAALGMLTACDRYANYAAYHDVHAVTNGGNPEAGRNAIRYYGCSTCHTIPGIRDADAVVGPPLDHMANRNIIAGHLPNTAENLMHWIQEPREVSPHTDMPNMNVSDQDARDIVAYLYTLQ